MKSENKNFLFNIIYQLLTFFIPLITLPYVSRVLGVDNIGIYSYTNSIVYMFMLVGMLGINNYGNRAIAAVRDNEKKLSATFSSIYFFQLVICCCVLIAYCLYIVFFCEQYKNVIVIQGVFLLSVCFDINWFYFGIEKFKLTIFRNLIIKLVSLICVFIFVKSKADLPIYTFVMAGSTFLSQFCLIILLPRYVKLKKVRYKEICSHFRGALILFIPVLAFGIYRVMDKTMIGAIASVSELGYYENAEKIMNIPAAIISALGTVMLPRMSYILSKKNTEFHKPILESMNLAMKMSTMMCMGLILIADEAVIVLFGSGFTNSGPILKALSITIIASAWANVIRTQFLIPLKKDSVYVVSTIGAAVVNLLLNIIFINKYGAIGACIGTVAAEFFVAIYQTVVTRHELDYLLYLKNALLDCVNAIGIILVAQFLSMFVSSITGKFLIKLVVSILLFIIVNIKYIIQDFFGRKNRTI